MRLPEEFEKRMKEYLADEFDAFIAAYDRQEIKGLRLNNLAPGVSLGAICDKDQVGQLSKVPWEDSGYSYSIDTLHPGKHPYHEAGAYYIQEPSAMSPVTYLEIEPNDRVLDLCAAPGGKSTQIAAYLKGEGILVSNEIMSDRAKILSENIERMGVRNALVISEDPRNISDRFSGYFDKILVDAPCSGEGMFRRSETAVNEWSIDNVILCRDRQSWILDEAAKMLCSGGALCYSTCTFSREENEQQIDEFLKRHEEFSLAPMTVHEGMREGFDGIGIRLWPHHVNGEGHFVCKLVKGEQKQMKCPPPYGYEPDISAKDKSELKEMYSFFDNILNNKCDPKTGVDDFKDYMKKRRITRFKDQVYLLPADCPSLKGMKVLRPGLHLGTILKNRFEPAHALARTLGSFEVTKCCDLTAQSSEIYKYLNGETFNMPLENGWHLVTVDGFSVGWGKVTNGIVKNHYPKGLRKDLRRG